MSVLFNNPETVEDVTVTALSTLAALAVPVLALLASF